VQREAGRASASAGARSASSRRTIDRAYIDNIRIETGQAAALPTKNMYYGFGSLFIGVIAVVAPAARGVDLGAIHLVFALVMTALGVLFLWSASPRTLVHLNSEERYCTLHVGAGMTTAEAAGICARLRDDLGYTANVEWSSPADL
jgi:hypothetical protein